MENFWERLKIERQGKLGSRDAKPQTNSKGKEKELMERLKSRREQRNMGAKKCSLRATMGYLFIISIYETMPSAKPSGYTWNNK